MLLRFRVQDERMKFHKDGHTKQKDTLTELTKFKQNSNNTKTFLRTLLYNAEKMLGGMWHESMA